jgi:hypothetical protein
MQRSALAARVLHKRQTFESLVVRHLPPSLIRSKVALIYLKSVLIRSKASPVCAIIYYT